MTLYRGGSLLVARDIALPCTGNNALLRPSAAAPLRTGTLTGGAGGAAKPALAWRRARDKRQGRLSTRETKSGKTRVGERKNIRGQFVGDAHAKLDPLAVPLI